MGHQHFTDCVCSGLLSAGDELACFDILQYLDMDELLLCESRLALTTDFGELDKESLEQLLTGSF